MLGGRRRAHARGRRPGAAAGAGVVTWQLASHRWCSALVLARGLRLVRARAAARAGARAGGGAGRAGGRRPAGLRGHPERQAHHRHRAVRRLRARRRARASRSARSPRSCRTSSSARARGRRGRWRRGAAWAWAARCWRGHARAGARAGCRWRSRAGSPGWRSGRCMDVYQWTLAARAGPGHLPRGVRHLAAVQLGPCDRQRGVLPADRARRSSARCARYRRRFEVRWAPRAAGPRCVAAPWSLLAARRRRRRAASPGARPRRAATSSGAQNATAASAPTRGQALDPALHRLGRARPGVGAAQPARRARAAAARSSTTCARHAATLATSASSSARCWCCAPPGVSPRRFARPRPGRPTCCGASRGDGSWRGNVTYTAFGVLALRAGGRGARRGLVQRRAGYAAAQPERRRRLRLRAGRAVSDVDDDRGGAAGAGGRRPGRRHGRAEGRGAACAPRSNPDGGFGQIGGQAVQRAVHRLGDAGAVSRSRAGDAGTGPVALPPRPPAPRRPHPLLAHERPDAGLGHRPGAHRAATQAVPAGHGAAEEAVAEEGQGEEGGRGQAQEGARGGRPRWNRPRRGPGVRSRPMPKSLGPSASRPPRATTIPATASPPRW